ncbi:cytochrome P450 2J2-like [Anneissia japonica]|uniref:cytochrome P450 2J2-like n=1 Tax=Anneissia japonica TaxID=1529436 RepID=UPI00142592E9|nr:cytochrome P450 2J2-like [Anneissia japonica]
MIMATESKESEKVQCPLASKKLPGPPQGRLFGNIFQLEERSHLSWTKWSKEFGTIYEISMGPMGKAIVISGAEELANAYEPGSENDIAFSDRWRPPVLEKVGYAGSLIWENWLEGAKERKHLLEEVLKNMDMEGLLKKEMNALCDVLSTKKQVDVCELLDQANNNILLSLTLNRGDRYEYTDDEFKKLSEVLTSYNKHQLVVSPMNLMQCLWHTPLYSAMRKSLERMKTILHPYIESHRDDFDRRNIRDLIDGYLGGIGETSFDVQEAVIHTSSLFPSSCSLKASMKWAILFVLSDDGVQTEIQEEIDRILADTDEVSEEVVISKMPYINAVIQESLRLSSPIAQLLPHCPVKDTHFAGYEFKKDTIIFSNLWGPNHDPERWSDPLLFKPDRWLNPENLPPNFMPFGSGLRKCPAYDMALTALRMLIVTVFKTFHLKSVDGEKLPTLDDSFMYIGAVFPKQFNLIATPRELKRSH